MRHYIFTIAILFSAMFFSCEDVIEVDTPTEPPRLIIEALIRVDTTEAITIARIKISETNSFFETVVPTGVEQITLSALDGTPGYILLEEEPSSGIYSREVGTNFLMTKEVFLQIDFQDEFYVAFATFQPTVPIDSIEIGEENLIDEDETEIIVKFTDNEERDDFYLFDFDFGNYLITEDEFYQGQQFSFSYFCDQELESGQELEISIMGVDENFYNYMGKLIEQSEGSFGPFETPALTVRGNIINATDIDNINDFNNVGNPDNFALGYFAIVQEFKTTLTIQ